MFDEKAFYGYLDRAYFLEGDNLRIVYENICKELAQNSDEVRDGFYASPSASERDAVVIVKYENEPLEYVSLYFSPCIANILFCPETKYLSDVVERIAQENNFKLMNE